MLALLFPLFFPPPPLPHFIYGLVGYLFIFIMLKFLLFPLYCVNAQQYYKERPILMTLAQMCVIA